MAIKALKQTISIGEIQKMLHQWKAKGVTDSATVKLLDLYLGMPNFMNEQGIYPINNLYQICLALKTIHTADILEYIKKCKSFGLIWNEKQTMIIAFFTPLWHQGNTTPVAAPTAPVVSPAVSSAVSPAVSPAETNPKSNDSILYNITNIYPPEDSRQGYPTENPKESPKKNPKESQAGIRSGNPSEVPDGNPGGKEVPGTSPAKDFFHRINVTPGEKQQILLPLIDSIAARHNYTRPRAAEALVILVNEILIPYFDADPRFLKTTHAGRIIWLKNLLKTRHGDTLMQQAIQKLCKTLVQDVEKKRRKRREFRPISPFEWKDPDKDIRYYDDPLDGKVELPADAPPRPSETAVWNIISQEWVIDNGQ